jgi:predicted negative regulator of RcsB-dependent stress response
MVEDYLSDREQEEALRSWWRENWRWIIGGVALGLALLGGWRYWQTYQQQRADQAAGLYQQFQGALNTPDLDQATRLLADLADAHKSSAYTQQARLMLAKSHAEAGKYDEAVSLLRTVADQSRDEQLAKVAQLRVARLLIQQGKHDEALKLLDTQKAGAFAAQVREIRGDALVAKGDPAGARAEYAAALADPQAQVDRAIIELKLQELSVDAETPAAPAAAAEGQS